MDPSRPESFNHRTELLSTGRIYHFVCVSNQDVGVEVAHATRTRSIKSQRNTTNSETQPFYVFTDFQISGMAGATKLVHGLAGDIELSYPICSAMEAVQNRR